MESEQLTEWLEMQRAAPQILRKGFVTSGHRVLQLVEIPTFGPAASYSIYTKDGRTPPTNHRVEFLRWRRDVDVEKFRTPVQRLKYPRLLSPTIERYSADLSDEAFQQILGLFRSIVIPILNGNPNIGLDGTVYEIELGERSSQSRFCWWNQPPEAWSAIGNAFQEAWREIEKLKYNSI